MAHPTLSALPGELQQEIIAYLDGFSKLRLRTTSRYYNSIIPLTTPLLLSAERASASHGHNLYACYSPTCLRLRLPWRFADNMRTGARNKNGSRQTERFCVACGLARHPPKNRRYGKHAVLVVGMKRYVPCPCGRWGLVAVDKGGFYECRWTCYVCFDPVERLLSGGEGARGVRMEMAKRVRAGIADERECELVYLCDKRSQTGPS